MNLRRNIKEGVKRNLKELDEAGCRYCTFVYDPDGYPIADEEGVRLLDCWFDDCNASVVPGGWCTNCPDEVLDQEMTKDSGMSDNSSNSNSNTPIIRRHDKEMANRRPYSARYRDMRGSRDMGKMNENRRNIDAFLNEEEKKDHSAKEDAPDSKRKGNTPKPTDKELKRVVEKVIGGNPPTNGKWNWGCCLGGLKCCEGDRWYEVMHPWG